MTARGTHFVDVKGGQVFSSSKGFFSPISNFREETPNPRIFSGSQIDSQQISHIDETYPQAGPP
jgi:hypothetical protein